MSEYVWEILIILVLILANGFFSAAEIAVIASRRGRLQRQAEEGDKRARQALELANDPGRFLPTVQVGITLIGTFTATFGGASLVHELAAYLEHVPVPLIANNAHGAAIVIVGLGITLATLVLGELVPKRLALRRAEQFARFAAPLLTVLSRIGRPAVWLMSSATNAVLMLAASDAKAEPTVSVADIEHMIDTGTAEGVLEAVEKKVAVEALRLGERTVRDVMRPRIDLDALDADTPADEVMGAVAMAGFSRLPVYERDLDHIVGFVHIKDIFLQQYLGRPIELRRLLHPALFVPETMPLDRLLELFQEKHNQLAVVLDEYGGTEGMVTLEDVLEELVGEIRDEHRREKTDLFVERAANTWLVDGMVSVSDLIERLKIRNAEGSESRGFSTISGLILDQLGRIPSVGDSTDWNDLHLEVVHMDGQRIDQILVQRKNPDGAADLGPTSVE
ncbi:MAG TPA: hemolysin family protein [Pirellulales bacterium]|nr:hemolysin family protein [Pirellulales bacterium]